MNDPVRILLNLSIEAYVFSTAYAIIFVGFVGNRKEVLKHGRKTVVAVAVMFSMGGIVAACLIVGSATSARYRLQIIDAIAECDLKNARITLNGKSMREPKPFIRDLMGMGPSQSFKSDVLARVDVDVTDGGREVSFVLGQDSRFPDAFWVFKSDRHFPRRAGQIGTLKSPALQDWLAEADMTEDNRQPSALQEAERWPVQWWMIITLVTLLLFPFLFWVVDPIVRVSLDLFPRPDRANEGANARPD